MSSKCTEKKNETNISLVLLTIVCIGFTSMVHCCKWETMASWLLEMIVPQCSQVVSLLYPCLSTDVITGYIISMFCSWLTNEVDGIIESHWIFPKFCMVLRNPRAKHWDTKQRVKSSGTLYYLMMNKIFIIKRDGRNSRPFNGFQQRRWITNWTFYDLIIIWAGYWLNTKHLIHDDWWTKFKRYEFSNKKCLVIMPSYKDNTRISMQ